MARKYFTIYGLDRDSQSVEKLTQSLCGAKFQNSQKQVQNINICDEAKELLTTHKQNIYFNKQKYEDKKYGYCTLKPEVKPSSPKAKNMEIFVFGYDIDIEKARELFEKAETENDINMESNESSSNANLFVIADNVLKLDQEIKQMEGGFSAIKELFQSCEDGRVFTNGKDIYAVMVATIGTRRVDTKAVEAAGLYEKYAKLKDAYQKVEVTEGIDKIKKEKVAYNLDSMKENEIAKLCEEYLAMSPIIEKKTNELNKNKKDLLRALNFPKDGKPYTKRVDMGSRELLITVTNVKATEALDTDRMKADGIYEQYSKEIKPSRLMNVVKLS